MRKEFLKIRKSHKLTYKKMGEKTGSDATMCFRIEKGMRFGTIPFWVRFQKAFSLSDAETWKCAKEGFFEEEKKI